MAEPAENPFDEENGPEDFDSYQFPDFEPDEGLKAALGNDSYYAILNVSKDAAVDEIKDRYRALAIMFHPDKTTGTSNRATAEARFRDIKRAYEVLIDPESRRVYDMLGEEGLKVGWQVGQLRRSPEEIRADFDRKKKARKEEFAEAIFGRAGVNVRCAIDARKIFDYRDKMAERGLDWSERLGATLRVAKVGLRTDYRSQINRSTGLVLTASAVGGNGRGQNSMVGTVWHQYSPRLAFEASSSLLSPDILNVKTRYTVDPLTHLTVVAQSPFRKLFSPALTFSVQRRLYPDTSGTLTYTAASKALMGTNSSLALTITKHRVPALPPSSSSSASLPKPSNSTRTTSLVLSPEYAILSHFYSYHVTRNGGFVVSAGGNLSPMGLSLFTKCEWLIAQSLKLSWMTSAGQGGLVFEIGLHRPTQKFQIPITIASTYALIDVFAAMALPSISIYLLDRFVFKISRRQKDGDKKSQISLFKQRNAEVLAQRKQDAEDVVALLREQVLKRMEAETKKKEGLLVVEAVYGASELVMGRADYDNDEDRSRLVDVTIAVQALVDGKSRIHIPGGRMKSQLLGFYDPCVGERKKLRVRYVYGGEEMREVVVGDEDELKVPLGWTAA